ncbi:Arp2/3 complex 16 kDa subunit ARPC5 [Gonapodya prolifera JEL478]|uniref:Actin-related protein 2/3 complex subunit 5 n=1 Tax=Gonapodya prolifera (strain JEL478) TaxID=1344416 RepID=A0A139ANX1_GONPJ|nr:Arp2/3 complex 16 kDa subunit ARPC5 [Gonapodya prolifera JEL478]|eukprot:KXS18440.1 Arp2/3 complex 16 kDa subunit ARPC5 [Gonapodya prolifera JEL478]
MSTTTSASPNSYRKLDVDNVAGGGGDDDDGGFDAGAADAAASLSPRELEQTANSRLGDVRGLITRGNVAAAIALAVEEPLPYGERPDLKAAKDLAISAVIEPLTATKTADIPNVVKQLHQQNPELLDRLMKFVYRGMAGSGVGPAGVVGPGNITGVTGQTAAALLNWHAAIVEVGGVGTIARVLTDRKIL